MGGNRQIVLVKRPEGMVDASCFAEADGDVPTPGDDEFLVRTRYLMIDPAIRGWLNDKGSGYLPGVEIGAPVRGSGLGEIVESNADGYPVGAMVTNMSCWQDYSIATSDMTRQFEYATLVPPNAQPLEAMTVLANPGWTAYAAVNRKLRPTETDDVLITAASSQVGSLAGQLCKKLGARVVGTAGSDEKCAWLTGELGFDEAINYRTEDVDQRVKALFPNGIDALFDNVGGELLDVLLRRVAVNGRVLLCGSMSRDNTPETYRLANYDRLMSRRATMMGFNTIDHLDLAPEATAAFEGWLADGSIKYATNLYHGLDQAPAGLVGLYTDATPGKIIIEL